MTALHTFHIPVLGLSYSIDTPVKVARFGISSVVSIIEDELVEKMRAYHSLKNGLPYIPITTKDEDFRARRITAYLDTLQHIINEQVAKMKNMPFDEGNDLVKYFELLPDQSPVKALYNTMLSTPDVSIKAQLKQELKDAIVPGAIDVNIMSKVDNLGTDANGNPLPVEYSDALSALRGYAKSTLHSSVVLSAGYNPRLYAYAENFKDFFPDNSGHLQKKLILKVSDYRSALIQGKLMAKKGIWVSEFRIESGLNCGGHAFATDGLLLGPILEEFKQKKQELYTELLTLCNSANAAKGNNRLATQPGMRITVQGGIGTAHEDELLRTYYQVDGTGWGSPFLLVPEATNVDNDTLQQLATAVPDDYYLSDASPLGVPFNNFRKSSSEVQRNDRFVAGRPGSPCYKKFLATNTEFTPTPICTASRQYQDLKIDQLKAQALPEEAFQAALSKIIEKDCLCEGLSAAALIKGNIPLSHKLSAVTICPGPNLAYFSGVFSLKEMVDHIYGRTNLLNSVPRPNMFVNELNLYIDYLKKEIEKCADELSKKQQNFFNNFKENLLSGINYYKQILPDLKRESAQYLNTMLNQLTECQATLSNLKFGVLA